MSYKPIGSHDFKEPIGNHGIYVYHLISHPTGTFGFGRHDLKTCKKRDVETHTERRTVGVCVGNVPLHVYFCYSEHVTVPPEQQQPQQLIQPLDMKAGSQMGACWWGTARQGGGGGEVSSD